MERRKIMGIEPNDSKKKALLKELKEVLSALYMLANIVKLILELLSRK